MKKPRSLLKSRWRTEDGLFRRTSSLPGIDGGRILNSYGTMSEITLDPHRLSGIIKSPKGKKFIAHRLLYEKEFEA